MVEWMEIARLEREERTVKVFCTGREKNSRGGSIEDGRNFAVSHLPASVWSLSTDHGRRLPKPGAAQLGKIGLSGPPRDVTHHQAGDPCSFGPQTRPRRRVSGGAHARQCAECTLGYAVWHKDSAGTYFIFEHVGLSRVQRRQFHLYLPQLLVFF